MIGSKSARHFVLAVFAMASPFAWAQTLSMQDAVEGKTFPASIKPADLPSDFHAVEIKVGSGSSYFETILPFMGMSMGMGGGSGREQKLFLLMSLMDVSWSSGKTVRLQLASPDPTGATAPALGDFLVTYKLDMGITDLARLGSDESGSTEIMLKLVLVRTDQIASISPRPKIDRSVLLSLNQAAEETAMEMSGARTAALQTQTLSNVKQMCLATIMYASDYDDVLPYVQSTAAVRFVTHPYIKSREIFKTANPNGGEIRFNMAVAGVEMAAIPEPANTILFYESTPWPDGTRVVGYVDGHARKVPMADWERESASLKLKLPRKTKPLPADWGVKEDPLKDRSAHTATESG